MERKKIVVKRKEITETPPSIAELKRMLGFLNGNIKKLFNTSGIQYRALGMSEKLGTMSEKEALTLLSQNGMLVKRPFLIADDIGLVGFKEIEWDRVFTS